MSVISKVKSLLSDSERPCFMAQSMYHKAWPSESDYSLYILIILRKQIPDGIRLRKPCLKRFRPMKGEDGAGTGFHILVIREARQLTGCLIGKADFIIRGDIAKGAVGITPGLAFDHGDVFAQFVLFSLR